MRGRSDLKILQAPLLRWEREARGVVGLWKKRAGDKRDPLPGSYA